MNQFVADLLNSYFVSQLPTIHAQFTNTVCICFQRWPQRCFFASSMPPKRKDKEKPTPTPKVPKVKGKSKDDKDKDSLPAVSDAQKEKNKTYWDNIKKKQATHWVWLLLWSIIITTTIIDSLIIKIILIILS